MKKITFLEGLPGVGKSTLVDVLEKNHNILVCREIENTEIFDNVNSNQNIYMKNDEMKINKYKEGNIVIDRGLISTLAYNVTKKILNIDHNIEDISKWFLLNKDIYSEDYVNVIYLKRSGYKVPYEDSSDPYGSEENQKLLEYVTIALCRKYVKNFKIINYDYKKDEGMIIDEIID